MMMSPESFIDNYKDFSYQELLLVRDALLAQIAEFERHNYDPARVDMKPSPETVYQCNLEYLGPVCELIAEKYRQEFVWADFDDEEPEDDAEDVVSRIRGHGGSGA